MKLEQQVANLELSRKLKSLGVKQESAFVWAKNAIIVEPEPWNLIHKDCIKRWDFDADIRDGNAFAAFTCSELGRMIPQKWHSRQVDGPDEWMMSDDDELVRDTHARTEADCRAKMLIYLIEQGIVEVGR